MNFLDFEKTLLASRVEFRAIRTVEAANEPPVVLLVEFFRKRLAN